MISFITKTSLPWIQIGYSEFALHGETGITIEHFAKFIAEVFAVPD